MEQNVNRPVRRWALRVRVFEIDLLFRGLRFKSFWKIWGNEQQVHRVVQDNGQHPRQTRDAVQE